MDAKKLALNGGSPVRETYLPYTKHEIDENDIRAVVDSLKSSFVTTGPTIQEFEEAICSYTGAHYGVAFSSGTAALHGAAFAAGLAQGTHAITTPLTFVATANAALYQRADVQFVDIHQDTLNIDPRHIDALADEKTKAVIAVDFAGHPCDYDSLQSICRNHNMVLIADAAHSLGATYKGNKVGCLADFTTLSFHPAKLITTGEGGMVLTNNEKLAAELKNFRHLGMERRRDRITNFEGDWYYEVRALGANYRMTDFQAALGLSQLKRIDQFLARRRELVAQYRQKLGSFPELILPIEREMVESAWHIFPIQLNLSRLSADRKKIFQAYRAENIGVQVHYIPVYRHPYYRKLYNINDSDFSVAANAYNRLVTLPLFTTMTDQDLQDVVNATEKIISTFRKR